MVENWIIVANGSEAKIYASDGTLSALDLIHELVHPESRARVSEIVSDDRGRTQAFTGGSHSAMDAHTDPHRVTVDQFARQIADHLREGRVSHQYKHLILVAPPSFLGMLRSHLDKDSARLVETSVHHDWTDVEARDLVVRLTGARAES